MYGLSPVNVSPFIRLARWTLFVAGVGYGTWRWGYLHRKEEKYRAYLAEMKPIWAEEAAIKKRELDLIQMRELKAAGLDLGSEPAAAN